MTLKIRQPNLKILAAGVLIFMAHAATAQEVLCNKGELNLILEVDNGQIQSAEINNYVWADPLATLQPQNVTYTGGETALVFADSKFDGTYENCHEM